MRHLNDRGMTNIVVVDELGKSEKWKNLVGKRFVDVISKHTFFDWIEGREGDIEAFIHLGACSSTVETDASYLLENNYRFTVKLAEYAIRNEHRFIYASSAATYGDGSLGFVDDLLSLEKLKPLNMYGYSKHLFDLWAKNQGAFNHIVGLKYFNVFGPNEHHKGRMASAVTRLLPQAKQQGYVQLFKSSDPAVYGDGEQKRDFIYVKDVARITCAFLENEATGIFNVGSGKASSWNELAKAVFKAIDSPSKIEYIDMPTDLTGKYQNFTCADVTRLKKVLKSRFTVTPLEEAVIEYVQEYLLPDRLW